MTGATIPAQGLGVSPEPIRSPLPTKCLMRGISRGLGKAGPPTPLVLEGLTT